MLKPIGATCTQDELERRIAEIALKCARDYPNIATCTPWTQLWAIEQSFAGVNMANTNMHVFADYMRRCLGWSEERYLEAWYLCDPTRKPKEQTNADTNVSD